ncbi:hypothetical protein BY996DRAFT_6422046 [Phakopsora pachyrhizi]|nr:hypothetical protein BY996DRAFT_6422046 [Phakopsora pachyrhizi]
MSKVCSGLSSSAISDSDIQYGLRMSVPPATGKTEAWQVLFAALGRFKGNIQGLSLGYTPTTRERNDDYNPRHPDFPLQQEQAKAYAIKRLLVAIVWAFTGG